MNDSWGRQIQYLRISVTDRCNLRCVYCMPPEGIAWQPHTSILTYEEIAAVVRAAAAHGIRQVRLTGGEPLIRKGLERLVEMLAAIPGIEDIALTTNGWLLAGQAARLASAGLRRVNISLDTLRPERYTRITRGGSIERVWEGIQAAEDCGLEPVKINVVAARGLNDDELEDMAALALRHPWHVRFIELMPMQNQRRWGDDLPDPASAFIGVNEILARLAHLHPEPVEDTIGLGPAREYRLPGAPGRIGLISPLSDHQFCRRCNRLRLTADGSLRPCLMSDAEFPLRDALRAGEEIDGLIRRAVEGKPRQHHLAEHAYPTGRFMTQIGG